MKLVLVAGFNPRVSKQGPVVKLADGWYKLCVENHKDSELILHMEPRGETLPMRPNDLFWAGGNSSVRLVVLNGTEDYINVFAEVTDERPVSAKPA